ncbi:uncharacterized protein Bfra_003959 [Botrytis fragariae]|uniref:Uncharacterized protein n=1 Tax=Botrytis fragariae TaxID=1964551 RepID=A0A8H6EKR6_9HELO|nr:uncharacterized protein Bfra_003959 [Botrytis fragariae]KAF5875505.1 hypothetical protein Bfra_003959 [Botrytis fragariae]
MLSNKSEKEESPFQPLPPLSQRPEWGMLLPESSPPGSIARPFCFSASYVRDSSPVAHDRSPASGSDAPNLVVSDRAEPDHGHSASGRFLYGPLRVGNPLRGRPPNPHDPYDMNKYHAINETARTSYPVDSDTTMNNGPASNPPPYNSSFVNGARGDSPHYSLRPRPLEWNPAFTKDQTYPSSIVLRRQLIASPIPASTTAIAGIPATHIAVAPAPVPAPATTRAAPVTRSTRFRASKQLASATNSQATKATQSTRSSRPRAKKQPTSASNSRGKKPPASAAKSAQKEQKQNEPWHDRLEYGIDRRPMKESELAQVRPGYGTLIPRKDCFKNAPPGSEKPVECGMTESELVWTLRGARGDKQRRFYNKHATVPLKDRLRATARLEARLNKQREEGRLAGYPATMAIDDRFPIVAPAPAITPAATPVASPVVALEVAPVVAGNAAESTEDQEMADDD